MATVETKAITRNAAGMAIITAAAFGKTGYVPPTNTTLNERLDIQRDTPYPDNVLPQLKYFVIGDKGRMYTANADGKAYTIPYKHGPVDQATYGLIPLVLRDTDNDLTPQERERYFLRRFEEHDGVTKIAYYARSFNVPDEQPTISYIAVDDEGNDLPAVPYEYTSSNLEPEPTPLPPNGSVITTGDHVTSTLLCTISLTSFDVQELINVNRIIYDTEYTAVISELAIVIGAELTVTGQAGDGSDIVYSELTGATVAYMTSADYNMTELTEGADIILNVGNDEPMNTTPGV